MIVQVGAVFNGCGTPQQQYDRFSNAVLAQIRLFVCPKCGHGNSLRIHGYYKRWVEIMGEKHRVRITRLSCEHCRKTHAVFGSDIIPYSRFLSTECHRAAADPFGFTDPILRFLGKARRKLRALYAALGIAIGETPPEEASARLVRSHRIAFLQIKWASSCHPLADTT